MDIDKMLDDIAMTAGALCSSLHAGNARGTIPDMECALITNGVLIMLSAVFDLALGSVEDKTIQGLLLEGVAILEARASTENIGISMTNIQYD